MPNRLAAATSPYLLQHKDNPVDWYPWGSEALAKAKAEDKPLLLSIGYAACHWCHVMAHESFEDPEIAAAMNAGFVNIKVDREERPDLDTIYQTVCQMTGRSGGWPLTAFLTPERRPFFVGTYFPPQSRHGLPGLPQVLAAVREAWQTRRAEVERVAANWTENLGKLDAVTAPAPTDAPPTLRAAAQHLLQHADRDHGGFGDAPKFPNPEAIELLLRAGGEARAHALFTLRQMARGGIYDQIGGGFHRYSVDAAWQVPHFEKMLYDNALLPPLYLQAFQLTGDSAFARVAEETCAFVLRELAAPEGGFFGTLDADSEGEEGRFYLWTPEEIRAAVDPAAAELLIGHCGVTEAGNFEGGRSVLSAVDAGEAPPGLEDAKRALWAVRERRVRPGRDEKILTSWNGLMIGALAQAGRVLQRADLVAAARRAAAFLHASRREADGGLRRTGEVPGFLQDYAYLCNGLIDLYEASLQAHWLRWALEVAEAAVGRFWDGDAFYLAPARTADLIHRPQDAFDAGTPSGQSLMVRALLRLLPWNGGAAPGEIARRVLARRLAPRAWGQASLFCAADLRESGPLEVVLAGDPPAAWLAGLARLYLPDLVLSRVDPTWPGVLPPPWEGKSPGSDGSPRAFVCRAFTCSLPLASWHEIEAELKA